MGFLGSLISGLFQIGNTLVTNEAQKKENAKQRDFESNEAVINRDFQAKQAELAFEREQEFYEKYQSIGSQVRQYKESGLNPALLAGGVSPGSSTPASSAPSGSMAHGTAAQIQPFNFDLVAQAMNLKQIEANIEKTKAEAREANGNALATEIDNQLRGEMNQAKLRQIFSSISNSDADTSYKLEATQKVISDTIKSDAETKEILENTRLISQQILTEDVDRELKRKQIVELGAHIRNLEKDTEVKAAQVGLVLMQTRMTDKQADLFCEQLKLTSEQINKVRRECMALVQKYDHDKIMYACEEIIARSSAGVKDFLNPDNYSGVGRAVVIFYHVLENLIDFSASDTHITK